MNEFCQISTELLPFIFVENWFRCSILSIILSIFFKFYMRVDIRKDCFAIANPFILSKHYIFENMMKLFI